MPITITTQVTTLSVGAPGPAGPAGASTSADVANDSTIVPGATITEAMENIYTDVNDAAAVVDDVATTVASWTAGVRGGTW